MTICPIAIHNLSISEKQSSIGPEIFAVLDYSQYSTDSNMEVYVTLTWVFYIEKCCIVTAEMRSSPLAKIFFLISQQQCYSQKPAEE